MKLLAEGMDSQTKCSSSDELTKSCYHPFTSNYRSDEELRENHGPDFASFPIPA